MVSADVEYVAHHWLLLAGPAFLPAVIVVGVVLYVAIKDRRTPDGERAGCEPATIRQRRRRARLNMPVAKPRSLNVAPAGNLLLSKLAPSCFRAATAQ